MSFTLALNFFCFIYTETWQVWIVPIELPNPKKHRYGRVKTKRYLPRQRLLLQLLLVIAAFILQTQWMLW